MHELRKVALVSPHEPHHRDPELARHNPISRSAWSGFPTTAATGAARLVPETPQKREALDHEHSPARPANSPPTLSATVAFRSLVSSLFGRSRRLPWGLPVVIVEETEEIRVGP